MSCLVGGVDYAPDLPDEPRSLHLFLVDDDGELVPVGKASAGVAPAMKKQIKAGLKQPPLIVEVEYGEVTDDPHASASCGATGADRPRRTRLLDVPAALTQAESPRVPRLCQRIALRPM